ncbi:MAG TPA: SUMF1/EgtB/PvdO family nonheme iron enzyme [Sedimentisphaerales bacterium]|nr:SUMF1/EgtB/PvdO family nonheme iron enzyme [Sedimentisphaerales bacterium]
MRWAEAACRSHCRLAAWLVGALVCPLFVALPCAGASTSCSVEVAGVRFEFVRIPPGRFLMGSDAGDGDERPVHEVEIEHGFDLARTEVTVRQFRAFVESTGYETVAERKGLLWHYASPAEMGWVRGRSWRDPGFEQTDDHPVVGISYIDAIAFCRWLSQQSGECFRLPAEAEWEYACRSGTEEECAGNLDAMAWYGGNSVLGTHPVAQKSPNAWGVCDMHGNTAEWCEDTYDWHYGRVPRDGSAHTVPGVPAVAAARRVLRGGSWSSLPYACRSAHRCPVPAAHRGTDTGFRIVHRKERPPLQAPAQPSTVTPERDTSHKLSLEVDGVTLDFVRVEPCSFVMGSPHRYTDEYGWVYETARHEVTIGYGFYLGQTEVTREQFELFVEETGYVTDAEKQGWAYTCVPDAPWHYQALVDWRFPGFVQTDRDPVTHIGWHDAVAFCQWLSGKTGREIRLPSEAEWEYACRAGTAGEFAGPLDEMAWTLWNSGQVKRTRPVAQKQPNAWGFYDMHGGVWEWVQDLWHEESNGAPADGSAWVQTDRFEPMGITRGGSFASPPWLCRSYIRMKTPLGQMIHYNNGFRIVCTTAGRTTRPVR